MRILAKTFTNIKTTRKETYDKNKLMISYKQKKTEK